MKRNEMRALIMRFLKAFDEGDSAAMLACLADDVIHDINQGDREIGKEKFRWFLAARARHFRESIGDIAVMTDEDGMHAAAEFTLRGTYLSSMEGLPQATGQRYALAAGCFFDVDDGRISRVSAHFNRTAWIEQLETR